MVNVTPFPRVELDANDNPVRAFIPSVSQPGIEYELVKRRDGSWAHTCTRCTGWVMRNTCSHVEALAQRDAQERHERNG